MTASDPELTKELNATLQARKDLGPEYESELIDSFLDKAAQRLDSEVERRVRRELAQQQTAGARVATHGGPAQRPRPDGILDPGRRRLGLAVVSMAFAIPLSAIGAVNAHLPGLLVTWAGIVGVNVAHSLGSSLQERRAQAADERRRDDF